MRDSRRLADLPPDEQRAREVETQREISDGLTSRHLANEHYRRSYLASQFLRLLSFGPALAAKLRGE